MVDFELFSLLLLSELLRLDALLFVGVGTGLWLQQQGQMVWSSGLCHLVLWVEGLCEAVLQQQFLLLWL